jgi:hypothetical protein
MKRRIIITICGVAMMLVVALVMFMNTETWRSEEFRKKMGLYSYGHESHGTFHDCEWNRDVIIGGAKASCARANGLPEGAAVTLEDIVPFMTNSEYYFTAPESPAGPLPPCPSGGTYAINPIGSNVVCSHSYHQWYNCMHRTH